jgi:anti-sigma factor RsiW
MTDDELAMAYADGELDALAAKRFEARMAGEPALGEAVAAHRALRARLSAAFAPVAEAPVPERLAGLLETKLVALPARRQWLVPGSIAASLAVGALVGHFWQAGAPDRILASAPLAHALDTQLASEAGGTRMVVSFRDKAGAWCRVFAAADGDGVACRDGGAWVVRQLDSSAKAATQGAYRQAGSASPQVMAAAQDMMAGDPLAADAERRARDAGWR